MKRCPQCNRVEADDTLTFCRVDGTALVRGSGAASDSAGTLRFGSAPTTVETETRILPTGEAAGRPTAPTTVLDTHQVSGGTQELRKLKSRRGVVIAAAAIATVAIVATASIYLSRGGSSAKTSIAVLPFQNAGADPDTEYLSDGITESLINSLSQLPNLAVKARSTMFRFKGQQADPQKVGSELNVQAVLSGRVVQRAEDLTLSLELVDAKTGDQIWGGQYSRKLTELVALQGEIARDVSGRLRVKLSGADEQRLAKNYTANNEAYQLYLRGRFHWNRRTVKDIRKSIEYFQQAVALDPNYTLAYTGLADAYSVLPTYGGAPSREVVPKAREAALKALSLDDQLAESHISLGLVMGFYDYDFAGAEREFRRAIELDPNSAAAHQFYGNLLSNLGRHEEALNEMRRALDIEPLSLITNRFYALALLYARRYDESAEQLKKTIELDAGFVPAHDTLANVYRLQGNHAGCVEEYAKAQEALGNLKGAALMRESFARGGWRGFLRAMTDEPRLNYLLNYLKSRYIVATYHVELGEKDKAFAELDKAYEDREFFMTLLKVDPRLDPLRSDARFADLQRKVGLPQ